MTILEYNYERKRIKRDKKLPPLCPDYEVGEGGDKCNKSELCKNATYGWKDQAFGSCYGGTRSSEREDRERRGR